MPKITQAQAYLWKPVLEAYNYCCGGCGSPLDLEYEHVIAKCNGGTDEAENMQILCHHCNQHKGKVSFPRVSPRMPEMSIPQILENRRTFVYSIRTWKITIAS
jgi:5-methylcytosine-specific restriction endonuclease McrA